MAGTLAGEATPSFERRAWRWRKWTQSPDSLRPEILNRAPGQTLTMAKCLGGGFRTRRQATVATPNIFVLLRLVWPAILA
jgi:hypothetical protein